jgi:hypothetical protein
MFLFRLRFRSSDGRLRRLLAAGTGIHASLLCRPYSVLCVSRWVCYLTSPLPGQCLRISSFTTCTTLYFCRVREGIGIA